MRNVFFWLVAVTFFAGSFAWAGGDDDKDKSSGENASGPSSGAKPGESAKALIPSAESEVVESELKQLRQLVREETERLQDLQQRLAEVEAEVAARKSVSTSPGFSSTVPGQPAKPVESIASSAEPPTERPNNDPSQEKKPTPLYFEIGRAKFTPGGFLDFTSIVRSTDVGSGIATAFGSIPYNNTTHGSLSEFHFSAQYSRLSLKVDAAVTDSTSLTGYVETDFLGYQPPNAYVTANSNSLRMRVFWANIKHGKWDVLGGQQWSLLTPNRVGLSPYTSDLFFTYNEDPDFQVGLTWARQAQFRLTYHPTDKWAVAVSLENPQQFAPSSVVFPSTTYLVQFDNGSGATNAPSATTNTSLPNLHPDVIVKTAYDTEFRQRPFHLEMAGLLRSFKVLNALTTPSRTDTITGGGGSFNLNFQLVKNLTLVGDSFYSDGGGRYIFGLGPDAIVKPNGNLSAVHSGSGIAGLEWQATPHYMFDAYYGGAYFQRNYGFLPTTGTSCAGMEGFSCVGFGFPGSANSSNRAVQEATFVAIPTVWSNPTYGKLQVITQYSYVVRSPWSAPATGAKNAHTSMVYAGFRYILP
jgi:hypothetical protein